MVKRRKEEDIAGVLEFPGVTSEAPMFQGWLAAHKAQNGGKVRVSKGSQGVRVAFAKDSDMALWKSWSEKAEKEKRSA